MFYVACTRFNTTTYEENRQYRNTLKERPVIYGISLKVREIYPPHCRLFVAEMNNDENQIEGIGLVKNHVVIDEPRHHIYTDYEYNRYIYRGKYWMSRRQLMEHDPEIIDMLENVLFKGKSHLKRNGCRITVLTDKIMKRWNYDLSVLKLKVKHAFQRTFSKKST
jgi:hypothetical protein